MRCDAMTNDIQNAIHLIDLFWLQVIGRLRRPHAIQFNVRHFSWKIRT